MQPNFALALAYLRDPRRVGAIAPASPFLARAMARETRRQAPAVVVEVGGGTGAVTQALLAASQPGTRLLVFERDPAFAAQLRSRYPQAEVINRCASEVAQLELGAQCPVTVVSSLPLLSLPRAESHRCIDAMLSLIQRQPHSRLLQYTYAAPHRPPFRRVPAGWHWRRVTSIWVNLPPATVWALEPFHPHVSHELH
jgi:phosphatidylethanolamine/phosphatidyl-N-methylethanolamine N-methyltransferase